MTKTANTYEIALKSLLLMIAHAKEEAGRLQLDDVVKMLEKPELSVLQTYLGQSLETDTNLTTMAVALSDTAEKHH